MATWAEDGAGRVTAEAMARVRARAERDLCALLDDAADRVTGRVPQAERLSWTGKERSARAWLAGEASEEDLALLGGEAALTGEEVAALAATIVARADAYRSVAALIAGTRRAALTALAAATIPDEARAAVLQAQEAVQAALFPGGAEPSSEPPEPAPEPEPLPPY